MMKIGYASERFGDVYKERKNLQTNNPQGKKFQPLREEISSARKQFTRANVVERPPHSELPETLRNKLKTLRRADGYRRREKETSRKRESFISNPFGFAKRLLGGKRNGSLGCMAEEFNTLFSLGFGQS